MPCEVAGIRVRITLPDPFLNVFEDAGRGALDPDFDGRSSEFLGPPVAGARQHQYERNQDACHHSASAAK